MDYIITCIIDFFLDPLKPHFYYISTGLRGSVLHGDFSLMGNYFEHTGDHFEHTGNHFEHTGNHFEHTGNHL